MVVRLEGRIQLPPGKDFDWAGSYRIPNPTHSFWGSGMASRSSVRSGLQARMSPVRQGLLG